MKKSITSIMTLVFIFFLISCNNIQKEENKTISENAVSDISEIEVDKSFDCEASSGVGVEIAYESENTLIFYGDFGLFSYDLKEKKINFSIDFVKAIGIEGNVQGSYGVAVDVSEDGNTIVISEYNAETETRGKTCYIDISSRSYKYDEYKPMNNPFNKDNITGYVYPGVKIKQIKYIRNANEWMLFE